MKRGLNGFSNADNAVLVQKDTIYGAKKVSTDHVSVML